jgi:replicative DNA helicase
VNVEKAVIGAVLLDSGRCLDELTLRPADFDDPRHVQIWGKFLDNQSQGKPCDTVSMIAELPKLAELFYDCTSACPSVTSAPYYARQVYLASMRRQVKSAGYALVDLTDTDDPEQLLEIAYKRLDDVAENEQTEDVVFMSELFGDYYPTIGERQFHATSGIASLDELLNGFRPGGLYIIGARPATGKTVVGLQVAFGLARNANSLPDGENAGAVTFHSLEMSKRELLNRLTAQVFNISLTRLERGDVNAAEKKMIQSQIHEIGRMLAINDRSNQSVASIRRYARSVVRRGIPLKGIVVDYLGLISDVQSSGRSRYEAMTLVSGQMKALAKDLNVPVVCLAQLNRNVEGRKDSAPVMADLRDSGSIEQDADVVMLLHRKASVTAADPNLLNVLQVIVAKNRHGQTGAMEYLFEGAFSRIREV